MANMTNPQRGGYSEGIAYYGLETTGMLADGATALGGMPTMNLLGYSSVPGLDAPENPTPRRAPGSSRRLGPDKPGRREPTMNGSLKLSSQSASLDLLRYALRTDQTIASGARHECLPVFALATGLAGRCNTLLDDQEVGRYCVMESLSIAWSEGQDTMLTFRARPLTIVESTFFSSPSEAALIAAGGDPFNCQELYTTIALGNTSGGGFDNVFNSLNLTINNGITLSGTRHPDPVLGLSNAVSNIAYFPEVGDEDITLEVSTKARLNAFDTMTLINENANEYLGFDLGGLVRQTRGREEVQAGARAGFSASYSATTMELLTD